MQHVPSISLQRVLAVLVAVLILKVTASIVLGYRDYFPPNLDSAFLHGREAYFFGLYRWAFYAHIVSGPVCLLLGLILISEQFRRGYPQWHRALGKLQGLAVLLVLTPSGLALAPYAETGVIAGVGFAALAIVTALCVLCGWRAAVQRRLAVHRMWMQRCFLLLCSAVVLRLIGGLATVAGVGGEWTYQVAAWLSWLGPLAAFELSAALDRRRKRPGNVAVVSLTRDQFRSSIAALSSPAMEISARR